MAGPLMRAGDVDLVVVGADRIAANGDIANKIGTYTVAVLAHEHNDAVLRRGAALDDRPGDAGRRSRFRSRSATSARSRTSARARLTPEGARIRNPAFDVTPHRYVAGIITERGIVRAPYSESLKRAIEAAA